MQNEGNVYSICLYDEIKPDRVNWEGEIVESKTDALRIKEEIDKIPDGAEINLYVNSNGGDVKTGLAIYSQLARKKCKKTGYVDGFACSIASVILMACDTVIMYPSSLMMIHCASGGFYGNADEHRQFADDLDVISNSATTAYLAKAGDKLDREKLDELLKAESWLSAADCLKYGLCDEVATPNSEDIGFIEQKKKQMLEMCAKIQQLIEIYTKIQEVYKDNGDITTDNEDVTIDNVDVTTVNEDVKDKAIDIIDSESDVDSIEDKNSKNSDINSMIDILFDKLF